MSFQQVVELPDTYFLQGVEFEGHGLFFKRMRGMPEPENKALGALLLDADQTLFLLEVIDRFEEAYKFDNRESQTMLNHAHEALKGLNHLLVSLVLEKP